MALRIQEKDSGALVLRIEAVQAATEQERLNAAKTFSFVTPLTEEINSKVQDTKDYTVTVEESNSIYDVAIIRRELNSDGAYQISMECEHISYRLNEEAFTMDYFTEMGTPLAILTKILEGTGFFPGVVEVSEVQTFSLQETASRRSLLVQFANYIAAELDYDGTQIHLRRHRGNEERKPLFRDNVLMLSKQTDKQKKQTAYVCQLWGVEHISLGDEVALSFSALQIEENQRIIGISRNPFLPEESEVEVGSYVSGIEDENYRILTETVAKGKNYFGNTISPEFGFQSVLTNKTGDVLAETTLNGDSFLMSSLVDGALTPAIYFDAVKRKYVISGTVEIAGSLSSDSVFTDSLYAESGDIAELIAYRLQTVSKVWYCLAADKSDINLIEAQGQDIRCCSYTYIGDVGGEPATEPLVNLYGDTVYWNAAYDPDETEVLRGADGQISGVRLWTTDKEKQVYTTTEATDFPATVYRYKSPSEKIKLGFYQGETYYNARLQIGAGSGGDSPHMGKAYLETKFNEGQSFFEIQRESASFQGKIAKLAWADDGKIYYNDAELGGGGGGGSPAVYVCNGVNDNDVLTQMSADFFNSTILPDNAQMKIEVHGVVGISGNVYSGGWLTDDTAAPDRHFEFGKSGYMGNRRLIIDGSNATFPKYTETKALREGTEISLFFTYGNTEFIHIAIQYVCTSSIMYKSINGFTGNGVYEKCEVTINSICYNRGFTYCRNSTLSNCVANLTATNSTIGFLYCQNSSLLNCVVLEDSESTGYGFDFCNNSLLSNCAITVDAYTVYAYTTCINSRFENCTVTATGNEFAEGFYDCYNGYFINCVANVTANSSGGFRNFYNSRLEGCKALVYTPTGSGTCGFNSVYYGDHPREYIILTGCSVPHIAKSGYNTTPKNVIGINIGTKANVGAYITGCTIHNDFTAIIAPPNEEGKIFVGNNITALPITN